MSIPLTNTAQHFDNAARNFCNDSMLLDNCSENLHDMSGTLCSILLGCALELLNHCLHILCVICGPLALQAPFRMLLLDKLLNELVSLFGGCG